MNNLRKWRRPALSLLAFLVATQIGILLLARTERAHRYLIVHLERSFGRPVEVRHFSALLFPAPVLEADQITVAEDPAFGNEYFLRADHLSARVRWTGLLRGHFEFGTLALSHPSLTLVQNDAGSWNLERWLPPAKNTANPGLVFYGPKPASTAANRLQSIEIDDGRINFKTGDQKLPFAFIGVSGRVEQISAGRWRLQIEAQPWRSGVLLQSAGTVYVRGDLAGTSARLQPAEIHVHWDEVSLADLFRLLHGRDYGLRGSFSLDGSAKSGLVQQAGSVGVQPHDWSYSLQARATQVHRWDLTERKDNPGVNLNLEGHWDPVSRIGSAERLVVQTPGSNLRGTLRFAASSVPSSELRIDSAGIQAHDVLTWYRAFQPDIDDKVVIDQFFTGSMTLRGWPLELQDAAFSGGIGKLQIPGLKGVLKLGAFSGGRERSRLIAGPVHISYELATQPDASLQSTATGSGKRRAVPENKSAVDVTLVHDFAKRAGALTIDGRLDRVQDALAFTAAFGRTLNHGWELSGPATGSLRREWDAEVAHAGWNGHLDVTNGTLQAAGLNQPLHINKARVDWNNGTRSAQISEIEAFGALWSGEITQPSPLDVDSNPKWSFQLRADHLDAADLDRWVGPRARPNWLQRLLPSLLGRLASGNTTTGASELLRRINAEGELRLDTFTLEKVTMSQVRANLSLHDLQLDVRSAEAQWAGGKIGSRLRAAFSPRPSYEVSAQFDRVNLAQLPAAEHNPARFSGVASGSLHLVTNGLGRDELLQNLSGKGEIKLREVEFDGWDLDASVADGEPREGVSRWARGEGGFTVRDRAVTLSGLRLDSGADLTLIKGTVNFAQEADLSVQIVTSDDREDKALEDRWVLKVSGPLDLPRLSMERLLARQPAD